MAAPVETRSTRPRTLLEALARARTAKTDARAALEDAERSFLNALVRCRPRYSWAEIAQVAGLTRGGVRYHVEHLNARRKGKGNDGPAT